MSRNLFTPPCGFDIADTTITAISEVAKIHYWGHRIVRHGDGQLFVHQAFYDDREGLLGVARQPTYICADDIELLRKEVDDVMQALSEPTLDDSDLGMSLSSDASLWGGQVSRLKRKENGHLGDGADGEPPSGDSQG